jgi:hypothetical protein
MTSSLTAETHERDVRPGDIFWEQHAWGVAEYEVLETDRERDHYVSVMTRWVTVVPRFRDRHVREIQRHSRAEILELMSN